MLMNLSLFDLLCYIQDKYNRVMRDKADLSDKADELEHLVLQLQGETDTIGKQTSIAGEYIYFYLFGESLMP